MTIYRYRWSVIDVAQLQRSVPGKPVVIDVAPGVYMDIEIDDKFREDLDEYMAALGWIFVGADPVDAPKDAFTAESVKP